MRFLRLFVASVCQLTAILATAQQLPLQTLSPANGLCDARMLGMYQDSLGRLYFLTREGFSIHDGQRITNFTWLNNTPIGHTNYMQPLGRGELLVSALSGLYILRNGVLSTDSARFGRIPEPGRILHAGNGHLLITGNAGLYYYNGRYTRPLKTSMVTRSKVQLNVEAAFLYGRLLLFNRWANVDHPGEWYLYDIDKELELGRFQLPGLQAVAADDSGRMMGCYQGRWQQLDAAALQRREITFTAAWFSRLLPSYMPGDGVQMTSQYVWHYRRGRGFLRIHRRTAQQEQFLFEQGISPGALNVFEDREGNTWFMTNGQGVQKLLQPGIEPFQLTPGTPPGPVTYLGQSAAGEPGFVSGNLFYRQRADGPLNLVQLPASFKQGPVFYWNNQHWNLQPEGKLQGSYGAVIMADRHGDTPVRVSDKIQFDAQNRLVLCGTHLQVLAPGGGKFSITLPYYADNVCIDEAGRYWCFTRSNHAVAYRLSSGGLQQVFSATTGLSARATLHWNKDSFLIGTRSNGLYWAVAGENNLRMVANLTTAGGLSNNFITALAKRASGEILAGTATGMDIVRFSATDTTVERMLSRINVFQSVSSIATGPSGRAWVYSNDQLLYLLPPPQPQQALLPPQFFFNGIRVNGNAVNDDENRFAYNRNNFRFGVSAPSFIDEKNMRFRFVLDGGRFHQEQQGEKGDFEINNLPPGSYTLTATVIFPGNQYQPQTIHYGFLIQKPFWKTAGFITGVALAVLAIIYVIFRSLLNRRLQRQRLQLEKEQAVSHERTRIATDMHDDLGAGLSAIKFLSQGAPYIAPEIQRENNLKISKYADELVDKMNDIIWAMNEKNDSLDNLIFYCKAWVTEYCDEQGLSCPMAIPANIPEMIIRGQLRQNIFLCIKEAVHNIVKHAAATRVDMKMTLRSGLLEIKLTDNGRGFDPERVKGGNGLYNMQKRMAQIGGHLYIDSRNGTAILFEIPLQEKG